MGHPSCNPRTKPAAKASPAPAVPRITAAGIVTTLPCVRVGPSRWTQTTPSGTCRTTPFRTPRERIFLSQCGEKFCVRMRDCFSCISRQLIGFAVFIEEKIIDEREALWADDRRQDRFAHYCRDRRSSPCPVPKPGGKYETPRFAVSLRADPFSRASRGSRGRKSGRKKSAG